MKLAIGLAALALAAPVQAQTINLLCVGQSSKDERVGSTLDLLAGQGRTERVGKANSISFTIEGAAGSARLPDSMLSGYREPSADGSFGLIKVKAGENEITGQIRINANNKPKFRLDRLTGIVTMDGVLGDFSGKCEPYDPATVQRKF